jgi:hypothetical protein
MSSRLRSPGPGVSPSLAFEGPAERWNVFVDTVADATSPEPLGSPPVSMTGAKLFPPLPKREKAIQGSWKRS